MESQKGVSLIIVFIILTVMLSVVLGFSTILAGKLKLVGNISSTVSSFYAAHSGIEKTGYLFKSLVPQNGATGFCSVCNSCVGPDCSSCSLTESYPTGCSPISCNGCRLKYESVFNGRKFYIDSTITTSDPQSPNTSIICINSQGVYNNTSSNLQKCTTVTNNNIVKLTNNPCTSNFDEVVINSTSSTGIRYNFPTSKPDGTYYLTIYSPVGLSNASYAPYTWWNWPNASPPGGSRRVHGGNFYVIKNDAVQFSPAPLTPPGGQRVSNWDIEFGGTTIDVPPGTGNVMTQVANTTRYFTASVDLERGDFLTFIVNAIKISGNNIQGSYQKNSGSVHVRICLKP
ncbi:MAG: hypothetical protein FJZ43_00895 [Candidatus Staskawiczbacteria bacterium]|nr:hypothetical protein [Candidatus Staskawiczbacteria bacterium]